MPEADFRLSDFLSLPELNQWYLRTCTAGRLRSRASSIALGKRILFQGPTVTCNFSLVWSLVR